MRTPSIPTILLIYKNMNTVYIPWWFDIWGIFCFAQKAWRLTQVGGKISSEGNAKF